MRLVAFALLAFASVADAWTTVQGIRVAGLVEQNPLMRWATTSFTRAVLVKTAALGLMIVVLGPLADARAVWVVFGAAVYTGTLAVLNWRLTRAMA